MISASFKHDPYVLDKKPIRIDGPAGRVYQTPNGDVYPSVTTVLASLGSEGVANWRRALGDEQADLESERGKFRGTQVHEALEKFIAGQPVEPFKSPKVRDCFDSIAQTVTNHLTLVKGQELMLWSDELQVAGTLDLPCEWDHDDSVVDFKTSSGDKDPVTHPDVFLKYFIQLHIYRQMLKERFGKVHDRLVIVQSVDHETTPATAYDCNVTTAVLDGHVRALRDKYRTEHGI